MLPAATVTRVIDRLVEAKVVRRRGDQGDRRHVLVFLSSRGRSLHRKLASTVDHAEAAVLAGFGPADVEILGDLRNRLAETQPEIVPPAAAT